MAIFNVGATGGGGSNGGLPSYYIYDEYMTEVPSGFFSPYDYYSQIITNNNYWAYVTFPSRSVVTASDYTYNYASISSLYTEKLNGGNRTLRIELPNVTSVNDFAFTNCLYLSEVILPNYTVDDAAFFAFNFQLDVNLQYLSVKHVGAPIKIKIYSNYNSAYGSFVKQPMVVNAQTVDWSNHTTSCSYSDIEYGGYKYVMLQCPEIHMSLIPSTSTYIWNYATVYGYSGYCSQLVPITTSSDYYWPCWVEYLNLSGLSQIPQSAFGNGTCRINTLILPDVTSMHSQFRTSAWSVYTLTCPKLTSIPTCMSSMLYSVSVNNYGGNNGTRMSLIELGISNLTSNKLMPGYQYSVSTNSYNFNPGTYHTYGIRTISLPNLKTISANALKIPAFSSSYSGGNYYYYRYWLDFTLDLRGVSSVPTAAANWLSYSSLYDLKIYVPRSLYNDFYNAANWSTTAIRNALISV